MGSVGRESRGVSRLWYPYRGVCEYERNLAMVRLHRSLEVTSPPIHFFIVPVVGFALAAGATHMGLFTGFDWIDRVATNTRQ